MGMRLKTLITICQSGGEFVKNKDDGSLSYVNHCGDAHAIDIDTETKFDDFKLELAGLWNYSPETVTIKYILPGHGKTLIKVSDDRELKRMIEFHENSPIADVFVIGRDVVIHHDASDRPAATMSEAVVPIVVDTPVDSKIVDSIEPDPLCDVPLESISPNQSPAIAVTATASAAEYHRGEELENTTGVGQTVTNMHEYSKTAIQRSVALILMKYNDYVGARNKLLEARTSDPGLEYIDELIKVCDMVCAVNSQGSGISWCSVLGINNTADQDDIEFGYKELMRTLEPVKNKFPEIQSALGLIGKAYSEFDSRGAASLFTVGQFLAVYDQEKMPRVYAQIIGIESCYKKETNSTDNILYVRWLRPAPTNPDERKWHEAGLPVSCGFFKIDSVGKCDIGAISHLVSSFREYHYSDKLFELYPQEGEVWALYEERKPFDWCSDPKTRKGCKFSLVEILSDYSAAAGFKVASLGKVEGYSTIFRRSGESYHIDASKLFGFSHNIPVRSTGDMKGLFAGTVLDLDPLSVPKDVVVDTVAAEFSNGSSSIMHQNSESSMRNLIQLQQ